MAVSDISEAALKNFLKIGHFHLIAVNGLDKLVELHLIVGGRGFKLLVVSVILGLRVFVRAVVIAGGLRFAVQDVSLGQLIDDAFPDIIGPGALFVIHLRFDIGCGQAILTVIIKHVGQSVVIVHIKFKGADLLLADLDGGKAAVYDAGRIGDAPRRAADNGKTQNDNDNSADDFPSLRAVLILFWRGLSFGLMRTPDSGSFSHL